MEKDYTFKEIRQLLSELAISQIETSEMFKETDKKFKETDKLLTEKFRETDKKFKETDKKFKETDKKFKETDKLLTEKFRETDKKFKETDKLLTEKFIETDKDFQETKRFIRELGKQIGGIGNSNGAFAEEFFYHGFDATMIVNGIKYDYISRNQNKKINNIKGEYDIVLTNKNKILVIEVKYKLNKDQVIAFYEKKLPIFKTLFPEFKNFTIYGSVASLSFEKNSQKAAQECGLLVFTQSGDSIKKISPDNLTLSIF